MTFPWEQPPEPEPAARSATDDVVRLLQRDLAYMVSHTAVLVHSNRPELAMLVNTLRGQLIPHGKCVFTDGSKFELQDVGMPQPGAPELTVQELTKRILEIANELRLELS